ncbi:hypothetical protein LguiB_001545 [Lonicera macranthoides]
MFLRSLNPFIPFHLISHHPKPYITTQKSPKNPLEYGFDVRVVERIQLCISPF